ncbi:la-related protein 6 [Bacillus rossius redtenbacheri]|uniref:la-related protein 6 n=1 Tax=Bacillus rossius redtenbacheri TaxID=93214 RepID=UPI002FDE1B3C
MPAPVEVCEEEEVDQLGGLDYSRPPMKHSDTRDSISSTDSDISLSYDKDAAPQLPDEAALLADQSDCGSDDAGSTTGKDSGCEVADQEPPFVPPDDELAERIVSQVEFYFSDVNITKDAFLLKHVKRNKEGYVSLKLISSFKRVKHLAKDWRVVAAALQRSTKLQINEAGTKLRRTDPLPQYDETTPSRTVLASSLPHDKPTIERVADLFSCFGEIALVRILRPGNPVPADARAFVAARPELAGVVCALVEFQEAEGARCALRGAADWAGHAMGVRVLELLSEKRRRVPPARKGSLLAARHLCDCEHSSSCASGSEAEPEHRPRRSPRLLPPPARLLHRCSEPTAAWAQRRASSGSDTAPPTRPRSSSLVQFAPSANRPRSNSGVAHLPDNVVRMPRGPDGSRGFACPR